MFSLAKCRVPPPSLIFCSAQQTPFERKTNEKLENCNGNDIEFLFFRASGPAARAHFQLSYSQRHQQLPASLQEMELVPER